MDKYFVIDFDSTFISVEGLDLLAEISLKNHPKKDSILEQIKNITKDGMVGKIGFRESLELRIKRLELSIKGIDETVKKLKKSITPSILRNKQFFKSNKERIYIVTGGFEEMVLPVVRDFGILTGHVLANKFLFKDGRVVGFDKSKATSQAQGKAQAVKDLKLEGEVVVLGDGFTDLEIKRVNQESRSINHAEVKTQQIVIPAPSSVIPSEQGERRNPDSIKIATALPRNDTVKYKFIAFIENVYRESIVKEADLVVRDFDEFLFLEKIPSGISYPKSRMKVLLLENIESAAAENFIREGYQVETLKSALSEEELIERIKDVSILGVRSKTRVSQNVLKNARKLKCIGAFSIGTDQIDLEAAGRSGVCVFNAPFQNTRSVVELALGEMIVLMRQVFDKSNKAHQGIWDKSAAGANEIRGKTLGIIGYGNIGSQLSVLAEGLGMEVIFYDKAEKLAMGNAKKALSMDEVLKKADVISIHVSGDKDPVRSLSTSSLQLAPGTLPSAGAERKKPNTNLISEREFSLMKDGVIFLNLSRGHVVDVKALVKYIKNRKIRGAGVDVFPNEPKSKEDPFITELAGLPNVILTPHIAGSTEEAQRNIAQFVSSKLIDFINTGNTYLSVNFPNINLPEQGRVHRLLHLHKNTPGVLFSINKILADNGINVLGQYLKTNEEVGYVITDVNRAYDKSVVTNLKNIEGTIRLRVLY